MNKYLLLITLICTAPMIAVNTPQKTEESAEIESQVVDPVRERTQDLLAEIAQEEEDFWNQAAAGNQ